MTCVLLTHSSCNVTSSPHCSRMHQKLFCISSVHTCTLTFVQPLPLTPMNSPVPCVPFTPGLGVKPVVGALDAITHAGDSVRAIVKFFTQETAIPVYRQRFSSSFGM